MNDEKKSNDCDFFSRLTKNPEIAALCQKCCGNQVQGGSSLNNSRKRHHSRHIMLGVIFMAIGVFWYANAAGFLPEGILVNFWPIFFTGIGLWIIIKSAVRQKKYKHDEQ
jgi:hypothetical protein